jgi:hypothetical protein
VPKEKESPEGGIAVATAPTTARVIARIERVNYAKRADRVVIRHGREKVVAIIEILSPGNKESRVALRTFVEKAVDIINQGVNLLVVDLFPPTPRDPQGIVAPHFQRLRPSGILASLRVASALARRTPTRTLRPQHRDEAHHAPHPVLVLGGRHPALCPAGFGPGAGTHQAAQHRDHPGR